MKRQIAIWTLTAALPLALLAADNEGRPPENGGRPSRPMSPVVQALDADGDGTLSAEEIANAATALKKLDKNGDGKLSQEELRPAPPNGEQGKGGKRRRPPSEDQ